MPMDGIAPSAKYSRYWVEYTEDDNLSLEDARQDRLLKEEGVARGELKRVPMGYEEPTEGFLIDPVIGAHAMIAREHADAQFKGWPAMPEDEEVSLRFPGIDPVGKYSVIDMKFAQREAAVKASLQGRVPEVQAYVRGLLDARKDSRGGGALYIKTDMMRQMSRLHRQLTRASKLCPDEAGSRQLETYARSLETDIPVEQYDKLLQGIEYAAGVKKGPVPREVTDFYRDQLEKPLELSLVEKAKVTVQPTKLEVDFEDLDHKLLQSAFSDPAQWGQKPPAELNAEERVAERTVDNMITPYARATANRAIDPLYAEVEGKTHGLVNRGDLIIVDGETVRERMLREYLAGGHERTQFEDHYQANVNRMTNEYVSAALMAGKRVEAFVPDQNGRIPEEPTQVTKTGYEPSPAKKVTLNAWQRFWSKRGYYKEKTAQAAEYQRTMEARERVKEQNRSARYGAEHPGSGQSKDQFFSEWVAENGPLHDCHSFSGTRSVMVTFAASRMLMEGHSIQDILDPTKLQAEKQKTGKEVMAVMTQPDREKAHKWAGEVLYHGMRLCADLMDEGGKKFDFTDPKQLLSEEARPYVFAAELAFDASQEEHRCRQYSIAAGERHKGKGALDEVSRRVNNGAVLMDAGVKALNAKVDLASGMPYSVDSAYERTVRFEAIRRVFAKSHTQGQDITSHFNNEELLKIQAYTAGASMNPQGAYEAERKKLGSSPEYQRQVGRAIADGSYQKRMAIDLDVSKAMGDVSFDIKPDAKAPKTKTADKGGRTK